MSEGTKRSRVKLTGAKGGELTRITYNVWRTFRVDIEQHMLKIEVLRGQRNGLTIAPTFKTSSISLLLVYLTRCTPKLHVK